MDMPLGLPCGKCVGCVQDRASEWALRCEHEARVHLHNWFITLTYSDEHVPPGGTLVKADLQNFWKRLRVEYDDVRYFACGEYGEQFERPHYHALVFGWLPRDLVSRPSIHGGELRHRSKDLERIWGLGRVDLAAFSPAAAQYVCNYVRKKSSSQAHYLGRLPEFQVMSRRPGIGSLFVRKFLTDIYPDGFVTRKGGSRRRAPRYYDLVCEALSPRMYRKVKRQRAAAAASNPDATGARLIVREDAEKGRQAFFDQVKGRPFEKGTK